MAQSSTETPTGQVVEEEEDESLNWRLAMLKVKNTYGSLDITEESLLRQLTSTDLTELARRGSRLPSSDRRELLGRVLSLLREGRIGDAKALIHAREEQPKPQQQEVQEAQPQQGQEVTLTFRCSEEVCNAVRELAQQSQEGDLRGMLDASLTLAARLANTLGMADYARLLDAINWAAANPRHVALLNAVTELLRQSPTTALALTELTNAVMKGDLRGLCESTNDLLTETMNRLPRQAREALRGRVKSLPCSQYPSPEELGL